MSNQIPLTKLSIINVKEAVTDDFPSKSNPPTIVIVRKGMITEQVGAKKWQEITGAEVIETGPITKMDSDILGKIKDKKVLLVGGYYRDNMEPIIKEVKEIAVVVKSSDLNENKMWVEPTLERVSNNPEKGFLTWTSKKLGITDEVFLKIAEYLDDCLYGDDPSEESLNFKNGVYTIEGSNDVEKVSKIRSLLDFKSILSYGEKKRQDNEFFGKQRLSRGEEYRLWVNGVGFSVMASIGDTAIEDCARVLSKSSSSGVGMLFRYDLKKKITHVTASTKESGVHAGRLMKNLIGGGGSETIGGGSVEGILPPEEFFKKYSESIED